MQNKINISNIPTLLSKCPSERERNIQTGDSEVGYLQAFLSFMTLSFFISKTGRSRGDVIPSDLSRLHHRVCVRIYWGNICEKCCENWNQLLQKVQALLYRAGRYIGIADELKSSTFPYLGALNWYQLPHQGPYLEAVTSGRNLARLLEQKESLLQCCA